MESQGKQLWWICFLHEDKTCVPYSCVCEGDSSRTNKDVQDFIVVVFIEAKTSEAFGGSHLLTLNEAFDFFPPFLSWNPDYG